MRTMLPDDLQGWLTLLVTLGAAVGVFVSIWRYVVKPVQRHFKRVNAGMDTLLGYPAVEDPGTGREIQPPTPPLASRVWDLEETSKVMAAALDKLADNQQRLMHLEMAWDERKQAGDAVIADFTSWREDVESRFLHWLEEQDQLAQLIREHLEEPRQ